MASRSSSFGFVPQPAPGTRDFSSDRFDERPSSSLRQGARLSASPTASLGSTIPRKPIYSQRLPIAAKFRAQIPDLDSSEKRTSADRQEPQSKSRVEQPQKRTSLLDVNQDFSTPKPSSVSPLSSSTPRSSHRNVLRRKPSVIGTYIAQRKQTQNVKIDADNVPSTSTTDRIYGLGLSAGSQHQPRVDSLPKDLSHLTEAHPLVGSVTSASSLHDPRAFQTPTPSSNPSVTPSLIFTESPSGFSLRTTPNSYVSTSPYLNESPQMGTGHWSNFAKAQTSEVIATATRKGITVTQSSQLPVSGTTRRPQPRAGPHNLNAKHGSEQVPSKQPRARTPPPELAHLMVDTKTTNHDQPVVISPKADTLSYPKIATHSSLPRLNTFVGNQGVMHRTHADTKDAAIASATAVHRKPIDTPVPSTYSKVSDSRTQADKTKSKACSDRSSEGRTTPQNDAAQKASSRFGFFSRKKTSATSGTDDASKTGRKGPVAGTGYEGFGKYASRRKSGSSTNFSAATYGSAGSNGSMSLSRARDSKKSDDSGLDEFLEQRLSPVYLRGDGDASESRARTSESTADNDPIGTVFSSPGTAVSSQSSMGGPFSPSDAAVSASGLDSQQSIDAQLALQAGYGVVKSESQFEPIISTESFQRPSTAGPTLTIADSDLSVWEPLPRSSFTHDYCASEIGSTQDSVYDEEKTKNRPLTATQKSSSSKAKPGIKWTWFSRSKVSLDEPEASSISDSLVTPKPAAHYEFFEDRSMVNFEDLQSIMEEADRAYWEASPTRGNSASMDKAVPGTFRLDGSPRITPAVAEVFSNYHLSSSVDALPSKELSGTDGSAEPSIESARPSRLAQVGRIPRVVSKRDQQRQLPAQSFSRPFADTQHRPDHKSSQKATIIDEQTPSYAQTETTMGNKTVHTIGAEFDADELTPLPLLVSGKASPEKPFLEFQQRKNSQASFSSSSRTSFIHTAAATAVLPIPGAPLSPDEIWDEYDDLIADVSRPLSETAAIPEPGNSLLPAVQAASDYLSRKGENAANTTYALTGPGTTEIKTGSTAKEELGPSLLDLRKELKATYSPTNTGPANRASSASESSTVSRRPFSLLHKASDLSSSSKRAARSMSLPDGKEIMQPASPASTKSRNSGFADPMSMANLRFGALMVSKWLSFGRVLVSPAHFEVESAASGERILIIDGLGKDWSYYCALTYSNAQVYSIGPWMAKSSNRNSLGGSLDQLPNYRHFYHPDLGANMPFPKAFFSVVVLRFPAVTTEAALRYAISECKRVLRPGGYIEISTLDLDLNNMGNKARRELRELKTKIRASEPDASLRSAPDNLQYLLGRKGFDNLTRCTVGVPVAGVVSESRDVSRDESVGIMELMKDSSEQGDRDITKMVAKVGRWWYSRCYEQRVLPEGDLGGSMWNDRGLLRECETLGTTFKLLICYAQKPTVAKRRAVSL